MRSLPARATVFATACSLVAVACSEPTVAPTVDQPSTHPTAAAAPVAPAGETGSVGKTPAAACRWLTTALIASEFGGRPFEQSQAGANGERCFYRRPADVTGRASSISLSFTAERFTTPEAARVWLAAKLDDLARGVPAALRRRKVNLFRSVYEPVEGLRTAAHWSAAQNVLAWVDGNNVLWLQVDVSPTPEENRAHAIALASRIVGPSLDPAPAAE